MRAAGHGRRRRSDWRSPGSRARSVRACQGLRPRRALRALAIARPCVLPSVERTTSAPGLNFLRGSMAGLHVPLSTLRHAPRGAQRMTRGQHGSLHLCCEGLAPFAPCRSPGAPDRKLSHWRCGQSESHCHQEFWDRVDQPLEATCGKRELFSEALGKSLDCELERCIANSKYRAYDRFVFGPP
jgi:hypothetical protein